MPIKICPADRAFSKCVREAAEWRCERCDAQHSEGSMGLHNAHFMTRGNWGTRFDPDNTAALCYGCHSFLDRNPHEKIHWFEQKLGEGLVQIVIEKAKRPAYGIKKRKAEIAKHYREELARLKELRAAGNVGRLEIIGYEQEAIPCRR